MEIKIVMNSGKEYTVKQDDVTADMYIGNTFYTAQQLPNGQTVGRRLSGDLELIEAVECERVHIIPIHISSIEIIKQY